MIKNLTKLAQSNKNSILSCKNNQDLSYIQKSEILHDKVNIHSYIVYINCIDRVAEKSLRMKLYYIFSIINCQITGWFNN